jgi:hypothetical protein
MEGPHKDDPVVEQRPMVDRYAARIGQVVALIFTLVILIRPAYFEYLRQVRIESSPPAQAIKLDISTPSKTAWVGKDFPVSIALIDLNNKKVTAQRDVPLNLDITSLSGKIIASQKTTIEKGHASATFHLTFDRPGFNSVVVNSNNALLDSVNLDVWNPDSQVIQFLNDQVQTAPASDSSELLTPQSRRAQPPNPSTLRFISASTAAGQQEETIRILPELVINPKRKILADGKDAATLQIQLIATDGNMEWMFYQHEEDIGFSAETSGPLSNSQSVIIPKGQNKSNIITLTSMKAGSVEIRCILEQQPHDFPILQVKPKTIDFIVSIESIGFEPISSNLSINRVKSFELYFTDGSGKGQKLPPSDPVNIELESESGIGNIESNATLTPSDSRRFIHYTGLWIGKDHITAIGNYAGLALNGKAETNIQFPWIIFTVALLVVFACSLIRCLSIIGLGGKQFFWTGFINAIKAWYFQESMGIGFLASLFMIVVPVALIIPFWKNLLSPLFEISVPGLISLFGKDATLKLLEKIFPLLSRKAG